MDDSLNIQSKSKYNISLTSLFAIRNILDECNTYSQASLVEHDVQHLQLWKGALFKFKKEVYPKLKETERLSIENYFRKYNKITHLITKVGDPDHAKPTINPKLYRYYWALNHKIELELRCFADKYNMLIVDEDDARWSMGDS